jgi:hypothetical protein
VAAAAETDDEGSFARAGDSGRVDVLVRAALKTKKWSPPGDSLTFGNLGWRPHLVRVSPGRRAFLHVQLTDVLRPYLVERLRAAHADGWEIHLVLDVGSLHAPAFLDGLVGIDVSIHLARDDGLLEHARDLLVILGERAIPLPPWLRVKIAQSAWERRRDGSKQVRGRRLEGLLAFLFGQVRGLRLAELNFRSATEEIDLVLQIDSDVGASWYESGVPFVLVESKNWSGSVGSSEVSSFLVKVQFKRGRCRIGIMCASGGFSPEARSQELRLSGTNITIVLIDPGMIADWIASDDPTKWLDRTVRRAMLR